ncbi:Nucleolar protein 12 [Actinomortierella wolfii]|nr:Nucleolar protein 12 [Actinomortierella wolfii]
MSLTASLLKGAEIDSSLDSLFKNSAGPSQTPKAQEAVQPRKPKVTDIEEPKIKQKNPKPKATQPKKKQQQQKKDSDSDSDEDQEDEDSDGDVEDTKNKKKAAKKSVEEKYEAKKASEAKKKQAKNATPKETQELLKNQTKYDYGEDEEESKPEDLVHESLRNKRKATDDGDNEDDSPAKKSKKDENEEEDDEDEEADEKKNTKAKKADDPERRARTLFIGNLAVSAISKADFKKLKQKFSEFGKIESIRFRSVAFSELLPRKVAFITGKLHPERDVLNAYIVYKEKESVAKAVAAMNGQLFLNKHLRVDNADGEKNYNPKKSIFVGNLAFDAQEEDLWNFFKDSGDIENVRIIRDRKTNLGKGFAYVQFQDRASVDLALRLHDTKMGSRKLRVTRCKKIEDEANKTNGMQAAKKGGKSLHTTTAPSKPLTGAAKRLAMKASKAKDRHTLKKGGNVIVEGERATKGAKVDLGIKKGKAKVKANVPKKKKVKAPKK